MRQALRLAPALIVSLSVFGLVAAQSPEGTPKPGPEQKKLEWFVGKWSGKAVMKPGPFGPGGPMTWTETCEWFEGGFHLVCRSEGTSPTGPMKGIGIIGYDAERKLYTYYGVDNTGWSDLATGTFSGRTWSYSNEFTMGGKKYWSRMSIEELSDREQRFRWETSEDGKTWALVMEGGSTK